MPIVFHREGRQGFSRSNGGPAEPNLVRAVHAIRASPALNFFIFKMLLGVMFFFNTLKSCQDYWLYTLNSGHLFSLSNTQRLLRENSNTLAVAADYTRSYHPNVWLWAKNDISRREKSLAPAPDTQYSFCTVHSFETVQVSTPDTHHSVEMHHSLSTRHKT